MNTYSLIVYTSDIFKRYDILSTNISDAANRAKIRFGSEFNYIGKDIKVKLDENDLSNHIDEILDKIYN